jgi:large subunit ribosomal protein L1
MMAKDKQPEEIIAEEVTQDEVAEVQAEAPEATEPVEEPTEDKEEKTAKAGKRSAKAVRETEAEEARQAAKEDRAQDEAAADGTPKIPRRTLPNPLHQHGKKYREVTKLVDRAKLHTLTEALELAVKTATTKFDSSVELHVNLGVDPRQADQMVRASVVLPAGTGKTIRVAVFAEGKAAEDAKAAGADIVGTDKLLADIEKGKLDFDMLVATPDKMATLGKVAKVLGPRGLMPNPKSGTVTADVAKAVTEAKAGKVEFRNDKQGILHQAVGKVSFKPADLRANVDAFLKAVLKAKPSGIKGTYVKAVTVTTSMGPGIKVDAAATTAELSTKK